MTSSHLSLNLYSSQVTPEGTFLDVRTIGRFCYEDDLLTLSAVYTEAQAESQPGFPRLYTDKTINSLKHRLLVYLWRRAEQDGSATAKRRYELYALQQNNTKFGFSLNFTVLAVFVCFFNLLLMLPLVAFTDSVAIITFTVKDLFCLGLHNIFQNSLSS